MRGAVGWRSPASIRSRSASRTARRARALRARRPSSGRSGVASIGGSKHIALTVQITMGYAPRMRTPGCRLLLAGLVVVAACKGHHEGPGEVTKTPVPPPAVAARATVQEKAYRHFDAAPAKQILFGDLHVHT